MSEKPATPRQITYAQWITEAVADRIFSEIEDLQDSGTETLASASSDWHAELEGDEFSMFVYCGDETASHLKILPPGIREDLALEWRSQLTMCAAEFVEDWNRNHKNGKMPSFCPDSYADIPDFDAAEACVSDAWEEWRRNWFQGETFMIGVSCGNSEDGSLRVKVICNDDKYHFSESRDYPLCQRDFTRAELDEILNSESTLAEGVEKLACQIRDSCEGLSGPGEDGPQLAMVM